MEKDDSKTPTLNSGLFFYLRSLDPTRTNPIRFTSDRLYTLGRSQRHCHVILRHRSVSRRHCQIILYSFDRKLLLIDGSLISSTSDLDRIRYRFRIRPDTVRSKPSSNGVFVNGRRVKRGVVVELSVGDEISFGCCKGFRHGFAVERIEDEVFDEMPESELINKASRLLRHCRSVLQSVDPVSCLRGLKDLVENIEHQPKCDFYEPDYKASGENGCYSDGKTFFLNHLEQMGPGLPDQPATVTLPELLHPVGSLVRVFMATFTSDVSWFLSYCQLPNELPITIACHSAQRCWSASGESRTSAPYSDYPNLLLVYPPFPDVIAFGKDRKKQGVACHHPKLIVLQRKESMRVVVTSANLTPKQWNHVTNTVWWQDFPSRSSPEYSVLFSAIKGSYPDFAAQLAGFIASLISDVPSQAHWIKNLTHYDFGGAGGHLVASIPGMHVKKPCSEADHFIPSKLIQRSQSTALKFLGCVQASVVGLSHRFHSAADSNGAQLKTLASFLGKFKDNARATLEVLLKRNSNIPADSNAMGVLVADLDKFSEGDSVQLGFLPRDVAKWVSPLSDIGFFCFSAFIYPKETLAAVLDGSNTKVPLLLHVSQGPNFAEMSQLIQPEHFASLCSLLTSMQMSLGLWRLQEVISQYKWPESLETDFIYGSSSIGTSVNPQFIASFSAAVGKKSVQLSESEESDPEWGRWTANHELRNPSIRILFPTIERVKNGRHGIQPSRCLLSLSEKTWQRMRTSGIFHDSVPHPGNRLGYPMHVKVSQRRFQSKRADTPPFGWIYCGSHNFSPAAWGKIILPSSEANISGPRLHICNYELGVILIVPPSDLSKESHTDKRDIDDIFLPFVMPAPKYQCNDRPATAQAMREAMREISVASVISEEVEEDIPDEEEEIVEASEYLTEEKEEEKIYAEMLWSQLDSSGS